MGLVRRLIVLCFLGCLAATGAAHADEPFYKNKRLNILINFGVGGPTDIEGRLFAKYIARHIAGDPNILVQNMDGAGGIVGARYLGEVAPTDGSVVGYFTGTGFMYALDPSRFRTDFKTYQFVAIQGGTTIHFVRTDVPPGMQAATDIVKAQGLIGGGLSVDTPKDLRMRLGLDMLGVPYKYVTGYRSSPPARLAFQKGEINLFSESPPSYRSVVEPNLVATGQAIPVWYDAYSNTVPERRDYNINIAIVVSACPHRQARTCARSAGKTVQRHATVFAADKPAVRQVEARGECAAAGEAAVKRRKGRQAGVGVGALARGETGRETGRPGRSPIGHGVRLRPRP